MPIIVALFNKVGLVRPHDKLPTAKVVLCVSTLRRGFRLMLNRSLRIKNLYQNSLKHDLFGIHLFTK